jgi:2-keto-4-pentenoate hydratase/2-oxohepta-3-ene-1,7-dioic acid hydratase in catechol pathway
MRFVSFGKRGHERVGVLAGEAVVPVDEIAPELAEHSLRRLLADGALGELAGRAALLTEGRGIPLAQVRLGPPVTDPGKIICVGLNYKGHADEQDKPWPEKPMLFGKATTALVGPRDDIVLPVEDCLPDYEVELVLVIGKRATAVPAEQAMDYVVGYTVGNDVSGRRWQKADGQFYRAKSCDTFFPCGPALVTSDEVADWKALELTTRIGGDILQKAPAADLIHSVPELVSYISRYQTLEPGDLISTGTPAGVGCYRTPPRWLQPGDQVECAIEGIGALVNRVVAGSP